MCSAAHKFHMLMIHTVSTAVYVHSSEITCLVSSQSYTFVLSLVTLRICTIPLKQTIHFKVKSIVCVVTYSYGSVFTNFSYYSSFYGYFCVAFKGVYNYVGVPSIYER